MSILFRDVIRGLLGTALAAIFSLFALAVGAPDWVVIVFVIIAVLGIVKIIAAFGVHYKFKEEFESARSFFRKNNGKLVQITKISDTPPQHEYMAIGYVAQIGSDYVKLKGHKRKGGSMTDLFDLKMRIGRNDKTFRVWYPEIGFVEVVDESEIRRLQRANKEIEK